MCRSISFLSGKGGSGKTTLALSMASMLSSCGIKVLLVDCDLSTNGATYFYEDRLGKGKHHITSFYDILFSNESKIANSLKHTFVSINENYDFMPSITQITKKNTKVYSYRSDNKFSFYDELCQKYDVVLFDCQAGYTDILKLILPVIDINLVVMEADAISSAAMRSLYLKIGDFINEKNIYQVFNKASQEEYEIYSKVSGGTVFTNIETIKFDWKIRKAFSVKQIPDMQNTSANYGEQVHSICSIIFPSEELKNKFEKFNSALRIHKLKEKEESLKSSIIDINKEFKTRKRKLLSSISFLVLLLASLSICIVFLFSVKDSSFIETNTIIGIPIIISISTLAVSFINIFDTLRDRRDYYKEISINREQLENIIEQRKELQRKIKSNEPTNK